MNNFEAFLKLHQQPDPLVIANAWDVQSARVLEGLQFKALATSSAAVAESLGYPDGEKMSFDEYLFVIKHIRAATKLPLSVDLETGYGKSAREIAANIKLLADMGVDGINIEDSLDQNGVRKITDPSAFADRLGLLTKELHALGVNMFIHVRSDTFLLGLTDALAQSVTRIKLYASRGAHGIFLPCITDLNDIRTAVRATHLPVSVMCMPNLPDFAQLKSAGVKRISMANFLNTWAYGELEKKARQIKDEQSFASLFARQ